MSSASIQSFSAQDSALSVRAWDDPSAEDYLAAVAVSGAADKLHGGVALPLPDLGGTSRCEFWLGKSAPQVIAQSGLRLSYTDEILFGQMQVEEADLSIDAVTESSYQTLISKTSALGFPHLLRVWNFFGDINAGDADNERYRKFCVGRARVIPQEPVTGYAAATAIGIPGKPSALHLHWLAARHPGVAIENPRQVSAWEYPREYGPVAPGFSRAMLLDWCKPACLLVSGTASVRGHASTHQDVLAQLDETLINIDKLIERAAQRIGSETRLDDRALLRVYLRDPAHAQNVAQYLREKLGANAVFMLLQGDICRRELLLEVEACVALR